MTGTYVLYAKLPDHFAMEGRALIIHPRQQTCKRKACASCVYDILYKQRKDWWTFQGINYTKRDSSSAICSKRRITCRPTHIIAQPLLEHHVRIVRAFFGQVQSVVWQPAPRHVSLLRHCALQGCA
jgi:hypothetical protein